MTVDNPSAVEVFRQVFDEGKYFYLDFTKADE
jgi:hypothetical protein